jgi:glycosyltransferase involved in cell wall biosynthesis
MSTALAGLRVSRRLGIPWITFLSDPWVDNPYFRYRGLARRVNARLEAKVFDAAAAVIVPSVRMQEWYVRKYGGAAKRIHVLPHSYDPAAFPAGDERRRPDARGAIVLRSVGSLSPVRTARGLIQALALARNAGPLDDVRVELIGPGAAHRSHRDLVDREGLGDVVALRGPVPYAESLALMRGADALVVIEAPMAESPYLPSKVADYVGAGPPILGLTPPGSELTRFLTAAGGAIAPPDDPERIRGVLLDLVARVRSGRPPAIAAETRRELDVTRNVARLVDDCERIVLATR